MALITVTGQPGCRVEEIARLTAQRLRFECMTEARLRTMIAEEFGSETAIPAKAYSPVVASILAHLGTEHHLVVAVPGAERLFPNYPGMMRVALVASDTRRIGTMMLDHHLDRSGAKQLLGQLEQQEREQRKVRFGRASARVSEFDMQINVEHLDSEQVAAMIESGATIRGLEDQGLFSAAGEAQLQFQVRLQLAKHGIQPPGKMSLHRRIFANPSEEIFANLLDFYRIAWEYEPRSFPIQWDEQGRVTEAFTPDFYLPEFDLYVELTTMKQSHVTKKNRKVKMMKTLYPRINIQVFYQKDFKNIVFKHGLTDRPATV